MTEKLTDRRTVLAAGGTALLAGLAGCLSETDQPGRHDPPDHEHEDDIHPRDPLADVERVEEPLDDDGAEEGEEFEIEPGTVELLGFANGWEGVSPDDIEGVQNPTLILAEGEEYEFVWENGDDMPHDLQIWDEDEELIDDLATEIYDEEGDTASLEFEASEEMVTYICSIHPDAQVGDLVVE